MAARRSMRSAVVIPNWNGARWLVGCLDAVAAQTRAPDEVVVVDNGSSDDSLGSSPRILEAARDRGGGEPGLRRRGEPGHRAHATRRRSR